MSFRFVAFSLLLLSAAALGARGFAQEPGKGAPATAPAKREKKDGIESKPASAPADAKLTREERKKVLDLLALAQKETLDAVESLSDAQWTFKPAPEKWSVGEVVEHLLLIEESRVPAVEAKLAEKPEANWQEKKIASTEMLEMALVNRSVKVQAPEAFQPTGKLARKDAIERYKNARAKLVELVSRPDIEPKSHFFQHPFFGTLNGYQAFLGVGLHNRRHNQQIAEVKATAGYPTK
jgi:uncharacterized damage-inducible protein DinB